MAGLLHTPWCVITICSKSEMINLFYAAYTERLCFQRLDCPNFSNESNLGPSYLTIRQKIIAKCGNYRERQMKTQTMLHFS